MPYILIQGEIEDYTTWKETFDEGSPWRRDMGSKGGWIFHDLDDPNRIVVLLEWESLSEARAFSDSPELRQRMRESGVVGRPNVYFLEQVDKPPA